jgi:hypothetical protein
LLFGFEARRFSDCVGIVAVVVLLGEVEVVVEARRGLAGTYGAWALAYEAARWLIVSIGIRGNVCFPSLFLCRQSRTVVKYGWTGVLLLRRSDGDT